MCGYGEVCWGVRGRKERCGKVCRGVGKCGDKCKERWRKVCWGVGSAKTWGERYEGEKGGVGSGLGKCVGVWVEVRKDVRVWESLGEVWESVLRCGRRYGGV